MQKAFLSFRESGQRFLCEVAGCWVANKIYITIIIIRELLSVTQKMKAWNEQL